MPKRGITRRGIVLAAALALGVISLPAAPVSIARAQDEPARLAAPALLSPVDTTATSPIVEFAWERVPGATQYRILVNHETSTGPWVAGTLTVNDRYIATVNLGGDTAWWGVAALNAQGIEGEWATATFTTAATVPTLAWPPDGATINHPDAWPELAIDRAEGDPSTIRAAQGAGADVPEANAPTTFALGEWRWGTSSGRPPRDPISSPPAVGPRTFTMAWPDGKPVPTSPADGATLAPDASLRLRWDPVPGAAWYEWRLVTPGTDTAIDRGATYATWADISTEGYPDDLHGGTWEWRVRAVMSATGDQGLGYLSYGGVRGPWSDTFSLTLPTTPAAAEPVYPAVGAVLDHWPVLAWTAVPGSSGYQLDINDAPAPVGDPVHGIERAEGPWFTFKAPGDGFNPMANVRPGTTTRYWRVRTYGTTYDDSEQTASGWRSFTVVMGTQLAEPAEPAMLAPEDCASDACPDLPGRPLLTWESVDGAAYYRVFVRWTGGEGPADDWFDTGSTGLVMPAYLAPTASDRVAWNVVACTTDACPEVMPDTRRQFRVRFDAPVPTGPADGSVQTSPAVEMSWTPAPVAEDDPDVIVPEAYDVQWYITPGRYGDAEECWSWTTRFTNATEMELDPGAVMRWRVRTYEQLGLDPARRSFGAWSPFRTITRVVPPAELLWPPAEAVLDAAPVLDWAKMASPVAGYDVSVVKQSTLDRWGSLHVDWSARTGATSARLPALAPGRYRWQVSDLDSSTTATGWFTIAGDPRPVVTGPAPGETVRADDAYFAWEPYPAHQWFASLFVQVSTTPAFEQADVIRTWWVAPTATALAAPDALPTGDLYWRVCASWDCSIPAPVGSEDPGMGATSTIVPAVSGAADVPVTSTPRLIHVAAAPGPDVTTPVVDGLWMAPIVGRQLGSNGATPVRLSWTATDVGTGIWSQEVRIRRGNGSWTTLPVTAAARLATTTILPGATYTVQVRATDRAGNRSAWKQRVHATWLRQENAVGWRWSGRWTRSFAGSALGDATRWSRQAGASASREVTASAIGIVAPKSATRGSARILVDGRLVATVRLDTSPVGVRRMAWAGTWPATGTHRVTIKVVGTREHPRVDLDALVVIR